MNKFEIFTQDNNKILIVPREGEEAVTLDVPGEHKDLFKQIIEDSGYKYTSPEPIYLGKHDETTFNIASGISSAINETITRVPTEKGVNKLKKDLKAAVERIELLENRCKSYEVYIELNKDKFKELSNFVTKLQEQKGGLEI